ncbi:MAG: hypothetical protein ACK4JE_00850 [Endomicrobiia bacterium]
MKTFHNTILFLVLLPIFLNISESASLKFDESKEEEPFGFSQEKWNEMRKAIEEGRKPGEKVEVSTQPAKLELPPPPPGAVIELPYETRLSISGRKLIGMDFKYIDYDKESETKKDKMDFTMQQELQVRIKGQVGRKISVNVDFDDTVPDKRDISVVYRGDPDEFVQEAAFGDINIALPNTEFVGYSKPAFGIKLDTKYKNLKTLLVASQAKGIPETKRFTGNTHLERPNIIDINYYKKKYYKIAFGTDTIKPGTEIVYLDNRNPNDNQNAFDISFVSMSATGYSIAGSSPQAGKFDRLYPGQHYTIDYSKGIIIFRTPVGSNHIICVDYQKTDGTYLRQSLGTTNYILIKDEYNTPGITREMKNYYYIGRTQIVRDNGRGNFFLKIVTDAGEEPSNIEGRPVPKYPQNIKVDFESGIFYIEDDNGNELRPFPQRAYEGETGTHAGYKFFIEYRYRTKTFTLRPGIIPESERVILDGKLLKRDIDYFIDYDIGILTFLEEDKITDTSIIDVTYEYTTFGVQVGETFFGGRSELSLTRNLFVGVSYMKNFPPRPQSIPDLRSITQDLEVYEVDSRVADLPIGPFRLGFGGEYAHSKRNMNTYGKAVIESMEGIKLEDGPSLHKDSWKYGWTPTPYPGEALNIDNSEEYVKDIYEITASKDEKQSVLDINYDLSRATYCAIVQGLSSSGLDFSKKNYLEIRLRGTPQTSADKIIIEFGQFNEDVDHDRKFDTEDINNNSILNEGEDIGWLFDPPDFLDTQKRIGAGNGLIDSEDLDNDGIFDLSDMPIENKKFIINMDELSSTKWTYKRFDLEKIIPEQWQYVKQIKITIEGRGKKGKIQFAQIQVVGNKWETLTPGLTVYAVNNYDNENYKYEGLIEKKKSEYEDLYGDLPTDTTKKEQALELRYDFNVTASTELVTRLTYTRPMDFSTHKKIKLFVYGTGNGETFIFRAGSDKNNYFEYKIPVWWTGWRLLTINQVDISKLKDEVPDIWQPEEKESSCSGNGFGIGSPSLSKINYLEIAISKGDAIQNTGFIWVNEIHATDPFEREGTAYKVYADLGIPGWATLGGKYKHIDSDFETFAQPITNQEFLEKTGYLNFTRLGFMPMSFSGGITETRTPSVEKSGELVSALEEDQVIKTNFSGNTSLSIGTLPRLGYGYSISISSISNRGQKIYRSDIQVTHSPSFDYSVPRITGLNLFDSLLPTNINITGGITNTEIRQWDIVKSTANPTVVETSYNYSVRTPFQIWNRLSLNPTFSQNRVYEKKQFEEEWIEKTPVLKDFPEKYDKSIRQTAGTSVSLRINRWLVPNANYSISTDETYNFTETDPKKISKLKIINRTASGDISASFGIKDIISFKPTKSLTISGNYRIEDGDKYENVWSSYPSLSKLWTRKQLFKEELISSLTEIENKLVSLTRKDTWRWSSGWNFLEGIPFPERFSPLNKTRASGTHTETKQYNYSTGTRTKNYVLVWPDLTFNFYEFEKILGIEKYISDSQLDYKTFNKLDKSFKIVEEETKPLIENRNKTNSYDLRFNIFKKLSLSTHYGNSESRSYDYNQNKVTSLSRSFDYSAQTSFDMFKVRFTPRLGYREDKSWPGDPIIEEIAKKPTQDLKTSTYGLSIYADTSFPAGIKIPILGRSLPLTNRFIFNGNYTYTKTDTDLGDVTKNRTDRHTGSLSADYEVSPNIRMKIGAGYERFENREKDDENYRSYSISGQLTIVF